MIRLMTRDYRTSSRRCKTEIISSFIFLAKSTGSLLGENTFITLPLRKKTWVYLFHFYRHFGNCFPRRVSRIKSSRYFSSVTQSFFFPRNHRPPRKLKMGWAVGLGASLSLFHSTQFRRETNTKWNIRKRSTFTTGKWWLLLPRRWFLL